MPKTELREHGVGSESEERMEMRRLGRFNRFSPIIQDLVSTTTYLGDLRQVIFCWLSDASNYRAGGESVALSHTFAKKWQLQLPNAQAKSLESFSTPLFLTCHIQFIGQSYWLHYQNTPQNLTFPRNHHTATTLFRSTIISSPNYL